MPFIEFPLALLEIIFSLLVFSHHNCYIYSCRAEARVSLLWSLCDVLLFINYAAV